MSNAEAYSRLDRLIHRTAFASIAIQRGLADLEDRLFARRLADVTINAPVFVTSLPRAGTTLFLEILSALPGFATHTYRCMPFVLCPLFWDLLSRGFRKDADLRERAHGDAVLVGYDSPEAFEEILWKFFWKEKYAEDRIRLWSRVDRDEEFEIFFRSHMRKVVVLSAAADGRGNGARYVSKNNTNIARLDLLKTLFPDCRIIIPVRDPWNHIASLRRQHERFTTIHARDPFSLRYMEWLGHFEFGGALKPINFRGWMDKEAKCNPSDESFWLTYWAESYESMLASAGPNVHFINYDRACSQPRPALEAIAAALELGDASTLVAQAARFRRATRYEGVARARDPTLRERVSRIHEAVCARAA